MIYQNKKLDNNKKVILSNYISLSFLQAANYILPLLVLPLLVRTLGTEKFGLVMFAQAFITFFNIIVDFGFNLSATREVSINKNNPSELKSIFSSVLIIKFFLVIISFILLCLIINFFQRFDSNKAVYIYSFGLVIGNALFPTWYFQGVQKMKIITIINVFAKLIFTFLVFIYIKTQEDFMLVPIFNSLGYITAGLIGLLISIKNCSFSIPEIRKIKKVFFESSSLFVSNFAVTLYTSCNSFVLGVFTNDSTVGIYASFEKLILAVKNFYMPIYQALFPWLSQQNSIEIQKIIKRLSPIILIIGLLISLTIFFFADEILTLVYDDKSILSFSIVFKILSFISLFSGLNMLYNNLYLPAVKKYKERMYILIFCGIFNFILSLILTNSFDIYGIAVTVLTTEFLLLIIGYSYYMKSRVIISELE